MPCSDAVRAAGPDAALKRAVEWIEQISASPRRPCSYEELSAALAMRARLREHGVDARLEAFPSYETFAKPYGLLIALALAGGALPRRRRLARSLLLDLGSARRRAGRRVQSASRRGRCSRAAPARTWSPRLEPARRGEAHALPRLASRLLAQRPDLRPQGHAPPGQGPARRSASPSPSAAPSRCSRRSRAGQARLTGAARALLARSRSAAGGARDPRRRRPRRQRQRLRRGRRPRSSPAECAASAASEHPRWCCWSPAARRPT